jgi:hypothetical protein
MQPEVKWKSVSAGGPRLRLPADMAAAAEQPLDSPAAAFEGNDVSVLVDQGPFSDPLTGYANRKEHRESTELIDGRPARVVSFVDDCGMTVVGAHFPDSPGEVPVTIIARAHSAAGRTVAEQIVREVTFDPARGTEVTKAE